MLLYEGKKPKKIVLAYSGGLDTSVILKWLQITYGCDVVTFTADLGQVQTLNCIFYFLFNFFYLQIFDFFLVIKFLGRGVGSGTPEGH
jgi:hypothetical protein